LSRRYWDPLSGRFECPGCGEVSQLGVVAYSLPKSRTATIPADWRPTIPQAVWMRDQARGMVVERQKGEHGANKIEGADWVDMAELRPDMPAPPTPEKKRSGPIPLGGRPGERSPHTPATGPTWRDKFKKQAAAAAAAEEATADDDTSDNGDDES